MKGMPAGGGIPCLTGFDTLESQGWLQANLTKQVCALRSGRLWLFHSEPFNAPELVTQEVQALPLIGHHSDTR